MNIYAWVLDKFVLEMSRTSFALFIYFYDQVYDSKSLISDPDCVIGLITTSFLFRRMIKIITIIKIKTPPVAHPIIRGRLSLSSSMVFAEIIWDPPDESYCELDLVFEFWLVFRLLYAFWHDEAQVPEQQLRLVSHASWLEHDSPFFFFYCFGSSFLGASHPS